MRYSIHSILRSAALLLLVGVIFLGCNEIPTPTAPDLSLAEVEGLIAPSASKHGKHQVSDMNDRFADETTGANGFARVVLTQEGGIEIDVLKHQYLDLTPYRGRIRLPTRCTRLVFCTPAAWSFRSGGSFFISSFIKRAK